MGRRLILSGGKFHAYKIPSTLHPLKKKKQNIQFKFWEQYSTLQLGVNEVRMCAAVDG